MWSNWLFNHITWSMLNKEAAYDASLFLFPLPVYCQSVIYLNPSTPQTVNKPNVLLQLYRSLPATHPLWCPGPQSHRDWHSLGVRHCHWGTTCECLFHGNFPDHLTISTENILRYGLGSPRCHCCWHEYPSFSAHVRTGLSSAWRRSQPLCQAAQKTAQIRCPHQEKPKCTIIHQVS